MDCPQCKGYKLEPYELEVGLLACRCSKCEGALLPLMNYRFWADHSADAVEVPDADTVTEDNTQAKQCPKCARLMTKFKVGFESENKIELCTGCDEAWLDSGEWKLLKALELHDKLPKIFTDAWQRNIRVRQQQESLKTSYQKRLGSEVFSKADEFKTWLDDQSGRSEILQYLTTKIL